MNSHSTRSILNQPNTVHGDTAEAKVPTVDPDLMLKRMRCLMTELRLPRLELNQNRPQRPDHLNAQGLER